MVNLFKKLHTREPESIRDGGVNERLNVKWHFAHRSFKIFCRFNAQFTSITKLNIAQSQLAG